jgi:hypothetical protein
MRSAAMLLVALMLGTLGVPERTFHLAQMANPANRSMNHAAMMTIA